MKGGRKLHGIKHRFFRFAYAVITILFNCRTGRAGQKGTAYTLMTYKDSQFAGDLVKNLEGAEQRVPDALMQLALQNSRFRKGKDGKSSIVKERPGLGAPVTRYVRCKNVFKSCKT